MTVSISPGATEQGTLQGTKQGTLIVNTTLSEQPRVFGVIPVRHVVLLLEPLHDHIAYRVRELREQDIRAIDGPGAMHDIIVPPSHPICALQRWGPQSFS